MQRIKLSRGRTPRAHVVEPLDQRVLLSALLDPLTQPRLVNPLPVPGVIQPTTPGGTHYEVAVSQFTQQLGLFDPASGAPLTTTVWGYNGTYPGFTIEAQRDVPITVRWSNRLVDSLGNPLPHLLPVDSTIHWADPLGAGHVVGPYTGPVPIVTHLHGGHSASNSDGLPDAWFTPDSNDPGTAPDYTGRLYNEIYTYDNDQEAATLWYHDHALGITRLNVYAGLAGFYMLRDPWESSLNLPGGAFEIPLAIQDRMFTSTGQLYYPSEMTEDDGMHILNPSIPSETQRSGLLEGDEIPNPTVLPEFFGDHILVNGKAWPVLEVEPRKYRFRMLNGSDSRVYSLYLSSGQQFTQIGTDSGLLNAPVSLNRLTLAPGERADVVLDFSHPSLWGSTILMQNTARTPFPKGTPADPRTTGQIMAFKVTVPLSGPDTSVVPAVLRAPIVPLVQTGATRELALYEEEDDYGRLQPLLGTVDSPYEWSDPVTESPYLNDVEVWEIYNSTPDTHPIHLHLVSFQVLSRQKFVAETDDDGGGLTDVRLIGRARGPAANEAGWKDTVQMNPGEVTRIMAKFDRAGEYAWHCHILSHEDHEMMRPYVVQLPQAAPVNVQASVDSAEILAARVSSIWQGLFATSPWDQEQAPADVVV